MNLIPTGRISSSSSGVDLVVTRLIRGSVDDVWASITESDRTARWFGRWEGDAGPGKLIRVQMAFEEGDAWSDVRIESCDPPTYLSVSTLDDAGRWLLDLALAARGDRTQLTLTQHLENADGVGEIGPGWEYYLDNLIASREDIPLPDFNDYYPSLQSHFEDQAVVVRNGAIPRASAPAE
ncbi:MAG: SRPBCC family protein [Nakamurella sp.]